MNNKVLITGSKIKKSYYFIGGVQLALFILLIPRVNIIFVVAYHVSWLLPRFILKMSDDRIKNIWRLQLFILAVVITVILIVMGLEVLLNIKTETFTGIAIYLYESLIIVGLMLGALSAVKMD